LTLAYVEAMAAHVVKTPIVAIPRYTLKRQRPDILLLLRLAGVSVHSLTFSDDSIMLLDDMTGYDVTLVDHNVVDIKYQDKNWTVREIVDHHVDQGLYLDTCSGVNRTIAFQGNKEMVASTCTLVAERMQQLVRPPYPASVALLLLGVILLDSINLSPAAGKVTQRDRDAVESLLRHAEWGSLSHKAKQLLRLYKNSTPEPDVFYIALHKARYDPTFWGNMSVTDALEYDLKVYRQGHGRVFGISTVLMQWKTFSTSPSSNRAFLTL
jgi:exopolyphosphatase